MRTKASSVGFLAVIVARGWVSPWSKRSASAQKPAGGVPTFQVDPFGRSLTATGSSVHRRRVHRPGERPVWVLQRPNRLENDEKRGQKPPVADCASGAPVMEFDQNGKFLKGWGGSGPATMAGTSTGCPSTTRELLDRRERQGDAQVLNSAGREIPPPDRPFRKGTGSNDLETSPGTKATVHAKTNEVSCRRVR